ncbi:MAG TPA: glycosyltransferase family 4 protein [Bacilli bacterium]|nr:glycosyltransferase family 4 protein [Bacilli bacterium]
MNIIYITTVGFDTFGGNNHLNSALIEDFLKQGHKIHLIQSSYGDLNIVPEHLKNNNNFIFHSIRRGRINKRRLVLRAIDEIVYYNKVIKYASILVDYDVIYYQSSGLSFYFVPKLLRKLKKNIVFNIQDLFPNSLQSTKKIFSKFLIKIIMPFQIRMYNMVSKVIVISNDIKNELLKYGIDEKKIHVVYNWYNEAEVYPIELEHNRFANKYKMVKNKFVVQYAGNLGYVIDYDFIINLAKKLRNDLTITIQIIGNGSNKDQLKKRLAKAKLNNVEMYPIQDQDIVRDVYSYGDLCFIPLKKGVIFHSVPSKASLALACSVPVLLICDESSDYAKLIIDNKVGFVTGNNNVDKAYQFIIGANRKSDDYYIYKLNSVIFAERLLSRKQNTQKIINIIENIIVEKETE